MTTPRKGGAPSKIDAVVATLDDGTKITAAQRIVDALRAGDYFETAAAAAGVHKETAYGWLRTGAQATARADRAERLGTTAVLTPHQEACRQFSDAVAAATAEWHLETVRTLEQMARGGLQVQKVVAEFEQDPSPGARPGDMVMVSRKVTVETLAPNVAALTWRLERRLPHLYSRRLDVNVTADELGVDEQAEDEMARSLAAQLRAFQAGAEEGMRLAVERESETAIDTTATEA